MDYGKRLQAAQNAIDIKNYRPAVIEAAGAVEHLLPELFQELLGAVSKKQRRDLEVLLAQEERQRGGRMTLGNWIYFYRDNNVFQMLEQVFSYPLRNFNFGTLATILSVRNDCAHENYEPTRANAEVVRNNLILFLEETDRAPADIDAPKPEAGPKGRARGALPPWTSVAVPHRDIRERRFEMGIFAANMGEVVFGSEQPEYRDATTFFNLTYVTRGLRAQLVNMLRRLGGSRGASPVLHLHTTFGGGKTHTMLAMYHLAQHSGQLAGRNDVRELLREAEVEALPAAKVAVIDGDWVTPGQPRTVESGITLHTLWGEIAYQLGGAELYELVRESDESRSAPGQELLQEMLAFAGPSLILIDELLNYATRAAGVEVGRGFLVDQLNTFVKALTQAVDRQARAMLVITMTSRPSEQFGEKATELYQNLAGILGRIERTEVIAESAEIYEILRRRLFETIGPPGERARIAADYWEYYRHNADVFPEHTPDPAYKDTLEAAYPFHPELIAVLRDRWGTISGFQKTRGVLQLLALVVSNLYRKNHGAPLIQVGHIDLADPEIRQHLLKHTDSPQRYDAMVGSDVAGMPDSKAEQIDQRVGRDYYKYGLTEGLATALFMYSHSGQVSFTGATRTQLWLGVLQPGLEPPIAADAFDKFEAESWYMEREGALARLGINPNLNMMLSQRVDAMRQDESGIRERIYQAIDRMAGDQFEQTIIWPDDPRAVRDNDRLKLVIGPPEQPWTGEAAWIEGILDSAGIKHREYRNRLVFLMAAPESVQTMRRAAVRLMALEDIGRTAREQLTDRQEIEFREQFQAAQAGLPSAVWGAYLAAIAPSHDGLWEGREHGIRSYGSGDSLGQRVWERLREEGRLLERFDPDFLLARSDERFKVLWPEGQAQVNVAKLWSYFARYGYLPILAGREVLQETIAWGVQRGLFAYCLGEPPDAFDTIYVDDPDLRAARCVISENAWLVDVDMARALVAPPEPEKAAAPRPRRPAPQTRPPPARTSTG